MPNLSDEAKEARNAYYRKYRAEHKDKVREMNRRYWEKKKGAKEIPTSENACDYCMPFFDEDKDSKDLLNVSITQFPHIVASVWINQEGKLELWVSDDGDNAKTFETKVEFCPMCGRKLVKNG